MNALAESAVEPWKVLLVDDEEDVIEVSRMVLEDLVFDDRPLQILTATSAAQARDVFHAHGDIALAFVDVVMETEHAGLELVKYVREKLANDRTRLILRTGNPGAAPQGDVVRYLEIDDYKEKTELTADRLGTSVLTSLRSYRNLTARIRLQQGLQAIIEHSDPAAADEAWPVLADRFVEHSAQTVRQLTGSPSVGGLVFQSLGSKVQVLGGFGRWAEESQQSVESDPLPGLIDHLRSQQSGSRLGVLSAIHVEGGLLLGDRPLDRHAFHLWIEGPAPVLQGESLKVAQLFLAHRGGLLSSGLLQRELIAAQTEVLFRLCEAVESRSKETGAHIRRIAKYAKDLACRAGLTPDEQRMMEWASPLHDIGKVAIPDDILHRPGALDAESWAVMKTHAEVGHRLLSHPDFEVMQAASEIAHSHHERWDGTGYPRALAGEEIPISGRIVALVDVFDALLSRRAYKEPWPLDRVLDEIRRLRGTHFDPRLTDLFLDDIEHFHGIFLSSPD